MSVSVSVSVTTTTGLGSSLGRMLVCATACVALAGCPKSGSEATAEAGATGAASSASATSASAAAGDASAAGDGGAGGAGAGAGAAAGASSAFAGKVTVKPAAMYVPEHKDWASVKWKNEETKHLGAESELSLTIDPSGKVSGSTEGGAMGATVIEGTRDGATVTATVRRKDPTDDGLTGTLVAKIAGDKLEGTMRLADANAAAVREGTFSAAKK